MLTNQEWLDTSVQMFVIHYAIVDAALNVMITKYGNLIFFGGDTVVLIVYVWLA